MPNGLALAIVLLILMLFLAYILSIAINFLTPYYTTPKKYLKRFLSKIDIGKDKSFVDLGCGDGRVVFSVYKKFNCKVTGYEISPMLLIMLKLVKFFRYPLNPKVNIKEESFFRADLSQYDVIYTCLPEDILEYLVKKIKKEAKDGLVVYSYKNSIPNLSGAEIDLEGEKVYKYTF